MGIIHLYVCCYWCNRSTVIWYSNISLQNKAKLQTPYNIFIKTNIYYDELKTAQHGFNVFISNCLFNMHMFNIQHKEHVQISHVSYIRKPRLSGNFLGNERVRINEVSLYIKQIICMFLPSPFETKCNSPKWDFFPFWSITN